MTDMTSTKKPDLVVGSLSHLSSFQFAPFARMVCHSFYWVFYERNESGLGY